MAKALVWMTVSFVLTILKPLERAVLVGCMSGMHCCWESHIWADFAINRGCRSCKQQPLNESMRVVLSGRGPV